MNSFPALMRLRAKLSNKIISIVSYYKSTKK
jgi:hypothetical protein